MLRFDLEQEILSCWVITDDLKLVKGDDENVQAIITLYELKFQKLWDTFEEMVKQRQI